jgi:hypothetical protein
LTPLTNYVLSPDTFNAMHSTASNNRYRDHRGHMHYVKGTTGGQQGDGLEMMRYSLPQHPIMGRVFARHRNARGGGFADDLNIYASLKTPLKVLVEMRQLLGEDAKLSFNMTTVEIYIPGVTRERARELVLQHIEQDPSLESLREIYELDLAKAELDIITVTGLKCVGVPIGTPEFVNAFVRSEAHAIDQDVLRLRMVQDPKIHYDLLRFCQHTRLAFLARNVPPDVMMMPADASFDLGRGDWGSAILQRSSNIPVPVLIQSSIVHAILQLGLGATFATLSLHESAWCCVIDTPQGWSRHYAFVSIGHDNFLQCNCSPDLGSLPHASEWVAGQNLADPNTWNRSALQILKQLHCNLLTHYNCSEWAPPLAEPILTAPDVPAQDHDNDSTRPLSLPPLNLLASLHVRQDEDNVEVAVRSSLPPQRQVTKNIMQTWTLHAHML